MSVKAQRGNNDFGYRDYKKRPKRNDTRKQSFNTGKNLSLAEIMDDLMSRFIINVPEEEFESFDRLFFQIEEAHWYYEDFYRESNENLPALTFEQFVDKIFEHCPALNSYREAVKKYIQSFYQYKRAVPVYGAIILNQKCDKVVLVRGWNAKTWNFPRGKINQDEPEVICAAREVKEEIGFDITPYINSKEFIEMNSNNQLVKLFIVVGVPEDIHFVPESRKEIRDIRWHSLSKISNSPRDYHSINRFIPLLKNWLKRHRNAKRTTPYYKIMTNCELQLASLPQIAVYHDSQ